MERIDEHPHGGRPGASPAGTSELGSGASASSSGGWSHSSGSPSLPLASPSMDVQGHAAAHMEHTQPPPLWASIAHTHMAGNT